jgi:hypothetical protein
MRRTLPIAGAVCLALALTALGAWAAFTLTSRTSRQAHVGASDVVPNPVRGVVTGGVLRVFGDRGQLLWQKDGRDFGVRLTDEYHAPRPDGNDAVAVHDLDEDGLAEVLIAPEPRNLTASGVFCFNHDGSLRFRHQPDYRVRYEHLACVPPWRTMFFKITGRPGRPHDIWVVSSHLQEFPTVVERLDAKGRPSSQYWSNGLVSFVGTAELGGSPVVLVGACSNEFKGATLAVLDGRHPTATAPAENPHYACSGCPGRAPLAFLVFPRLDVAVVTEDHSTLDHAQADSSGQLLLRIFHSADGIAPNSDTRAVSASDYVLGPGFRVVKAEIGERYPAVHRRGEIAGLLDHPFSRARDERYLWPVRRWTGDRFELVHGLER